jgi:hypothetical protein
MKRAAIVLMLALAAAPALAQKVYRCGPGGREFSQTPCKEAPPLDASDPRTAAQREQAQANARKDAELAAKLERERHARESAANGQVAAGFHPAKPASAPSAKAPKKRKPKPPQPEKKDS